MIIYISGAMTGHPQLNFPAFNAEAARLRALGYKVVNPAEVNCDPAKGWQDCMKAEIREMMSCDTIALLPGWQTSQGAHLELHIAHRLGFRILDAADIQDIAPAKIDEALKWV